MRKVLIATPSYDGKVEAVYVNSLVETLKRCPPDIQLFPVLVCYDALVQRARNDLVQMALDAQCSDIFFIDADQGWNPDWVFQLLNSPHEVIGGAVVKKSEAIAFNVKAFPEIKVVDGVMEVECVGTGFLKISGDALQKVYQASDEYISSGKKSRMVFDIKIIDGELVSEDNVFCHKWRSLGGKVYVDTSMTCSHVGTKHYHGSLHQYLQSTLKIAA